MNELRRCACGTHARVCETISEWTRRDQEDQSSLSGSHSGPTMESSKVRGTLHTDVCLEISEIFAALSPFKCMLHNAVHLKIYDLLKKKKRKMRSKSCVWRC